MNSTSISPWFWSSDAALWNYGDAITVFLIDELIYDFFPYSARTHIIGSVIFDGILQDSETCEDGFKRSLYEDRDIKAVFWGCGIRCPGSLSPDLYSSVEFLAVRGPVSASDLRLGGTVPQGDPALLLPALYKPRQLPKFVNKSVCVPHYNDNRTDEEICRISGCDLVLRPAVKKDKASVKAFIDAICSARFILAGAMHAAVTAAAYGVPFGFWDSGAIDIPTKWEDMASLLSIPCVFIDTVDAASKFYEQDIAPAIAIPSLWPLICVAPGFLKSAGMIKVLKYEMERSFGKSIKEMDYFIEEMAMRSSHHDRIMLLAQEMKESIKRNTVLSNNLSSVSAALESKDTELSAVQSAYNDALAAHKRHSEDMRIMAQEKSALEQQLAIQAELLEDALADKQAARQAQERSTETISQLSVKVDALTSSLKISEDASAKRFVALSADNVRLEALSADLAQERNKWKRLADEHSQQIEQLFAQIQHAQAQATSLRDQSQVLVAQHVALRADMALTESESEAKAARAAAALSRYWQLLGQNSAQLKGSDMLVKLSKLNKKSRIMREHREIISHFLDKFTEAELAFSKSGREQRITQYLMGVTPDVEDFPIFNRDIYLFLNSDVAEAGIEPFVHFIRNGQWEARVIHPIMDIPYYISRYPEANKFDFSPVEHYFKFGVSKNYDPSPVFSTQWYFDHYSDAKKMGVNPAIHYLRFPGCQPHPDFDSDYYRKQNLDVVRHGINPLAHYVLWGRDEGRRATACASPTVPAPSSSALEPIAPSLTVQQQTPLIAPLRSRPIVVMMDAFYPRPDEDSGSLDQVNFIRIFQNLGYDVAFIALLNFGDGPEVGSKLVARGAHCITASEFASVEEYLFLNQERIEVLFLSRVNFGGAWIDRARAFCPKARILFNTVDLHHIREEREAALRGDADGIARAQETKRMEYGCIMAADVSIVVSEHEQALLASELPSARVAVVPLMREISRTSFPDWQNREHLAFVGGFQHQPNIDAVIYFLDEIWPIVQARRPELVFHVIGSHLPDVLKQRPASNVEWVGYVPEIEPWLDRIRLTVAPLRYGAGAKGKVVSSLLNGVPCVATAVAAEGMGLRIGQDIVSCNNPQEFADAIIKVHDDPALWSSLSTKGFENISRTYSIEYAQERLKAFL